MADLDHLADALSGDSDLAKEVAKVTEEQSDQSHITQSFSLLILVCLLILTILTIWVFKKRRLQFIHETGMSIIYGVIAGSIIRFSRVDTEELQEDAVFDPAIFFYMLLPPIIFAAGYNVQKKHFFRNIQPILLFAFFGTIISTITIGFLVYLAVYFDISGLKSVLDLHDCLQFGALISATDPVTTLAIFSELHVDVDLYAQVFGESVLNDAVAIVMYSTITAYDETVDFSFSGFLASLLDFVSNFSGSLSIGMFIALLTALVTKYSDICRYPTLEVSLLLLMSYTSFLLAEGTALSGIVAIMFCGVGQAHYTAHNLSVQAQQQVHHIAETLNFLAENFVFSYLGISLFTYTHHQWKPAFVFWCLLACLVARASQVFPLSALHNSVSRDRQIPPKHQVMMWWSGLRGAIAFALAMKNTSTVGKQVILTTTLMIVFVTVLVFGGGTMPMMNVLRIKYESPSDAGGADFTRLEQAEEHVTSLYRPADGRLAYWWLQMDRTYLKPVFTRVPIHQAPASLTVPLSDDELSLDDLSRLDDAGDVHMVTRRR